MNIKKDKKIFLEQLNDVKKRLPKQYVTAIKLKHGTQVNEDRIRNVKNHGSPVDWNILSLLKSVCIEQNGL
jgi:hypothetical protein